MRTADESVLFSRYETLLATGARLFRAQGYPAVSTSEIGKGAGIAGPGLYRSFASKQAILDALIRRLDEWRVLSKKIPSVDHVPELLARENRHEQVTLNPHEWMLITKIDGNRSIADIGRTLSISSFDVAKILYGMITGELVQLKKKLDRDPDQQNGELVDLAARIRAVAEEFIGDSAHKTIEKHFLHALDGIMNGNGNIAVDTMVLEFEKTASLLRGISVTEKLRSRIAEVRQLAS